MNTDRAVLVPGKLPLGESGRSALGFYEFTGLSYRMASFLIPATSRIPSLCTWEAGIR